MIRVHSIDGLSNYLTMMETNDESERESLSTLSLRLSRMIFDTYFLKFDHPHLCTLEIRGDSREPKASEAVASVHVSAFDPTTQIPAPRP